jgi:hypothetical protein
LQNGLRELGQSYKHNIRSCKINVDDVVYINGSLDALKWAIKAKKLGKISRLIVGPVMVVLPSDLNNIICSGQIDKIILPSQWVKNLWLSIKPELESKIIIWPAGVSVYNVLNSIKDEVKYY